MSKEIELFRQTGLGKKISKLGKNKKCIQIYNDNYADIFDSEHYDKLIIEEKELYHKYSKQLELDKLKYQNSRLLVEIELLQHKTKMKNLKLKYNKLLKEHLQNKIYDNEMLVDLKRNFAINMLYNINSIDTDESPLLEELIACPINIDLINVINKLLVKSYCTNEIMSIDVIINQLSKESRMNRLIFG